MSSFGDYQEIGPIRAFILIDKDSVHTQSVLSYFTENWEGLSTDILPEGALALAEYDYYKYQDTIGDIVDIIISEQHEKGYFGLNKDEKKLKMRLWPTAESINIIAKIYDQSHPAVVSAVNWLINLQQDDGSFPDKNSIAKILLSLLGAGGGPTISVEEFEWRTMLEFQKNHRIRPQFIHTSPMYPQPVQVRGLNEKIVNMLNHADRSIKICSLYIDMLHEEIINICENKPNVEIKIISRPLKDIKGQREKIGKTAIKLLNIHTRGNIRTNELLHSRMIIVDGNEMIISTADLTRDQLYDEFNAGIYTRDFESISKADIFFENVWDRSEKFLD